jgi:hypothetical protein
MKETIDRQWSLIKQTRCLDIQDAIKGRDVKDFDPELIEFIADFVQKAPSDTLASVKQTKK